MQFTIHITHCHVEGAGLHNEYWERDIPCDDYIDIEVADETVHNDIAEMVYKQYIRDGLLMDKVPRAVREQLIDRVKLLLDDLDIWEQLEQDYYDELCDKYEEQYDHD